MTDRERKADVVRRCGRTTRAGGPCKAPPLRREDVCLAHADAETRTSTGFGGTQPNSGRPRLPKPTDLARQLIERHAAAILRPHFKALGLLLHDDGATEELKQGAVVVHQGVATSIEDLGAQIAAARELLDRVYGKPKQVSEVSGPEGEPIRTEALVPTEAAWHLEVAQVLADAGALEAIDASDLP